ncbi:2-C-methyl-D-erythritol 4-phosphate cytidylyltransferase [Aestuariimicrobium sp. T2.26MG-19.2B]|uniref:2-C-methyl-D-erythritol 4-phosphate cytidylyltransferase n=1 Tax=Aestuariimicrobium sp. T2.26MG-19.2B TaxID=3040679 RepID=UPI002477A1B8|nr:2-C-methyl-D-erythritol 4-phosphate cytidylyltransferase [Aestuariimicrobium sp. T2.26MG-19.2B]CAI9401245.1 2-C-methyl-D-erythritol 4-phosphate cytidylyltransferase [Aestuariimicrobium sp. T2.26MG-19.2B]
MQEPVVALVVAAGSGVRFGASVPKALVELGGRALVAHSVDALAAGGVSRVVVVVPADHRPDFERALADAPVPVELVAGGRRRQDSVRQGLEALAIDLGTADSAIVLVHDAARPLVPAEVVERVRDAVTAGATAVVPAVPVVDSIRSISHQGPDGASSVVDRSGLRAVQTPQGFSFAALLAAHRAVADTTEELTDDAAVAERAGHRVVLVPGSRDSIKITEPLDLVLAEALLAGRRTGKAR